MWEGEWLIKREFNYLFKIILYNMSDIKFVYVDYNLYIIK